MMIKIAVFASGNGTNAENLISHFNTCPPRGGQVSLVVCNRRGARVIYRASRAGVPVEVMSRDEINNPHTMLALLDRYSVDAIVLAGFLLMVPPFLVEAYRGRIINIHPSLLPRYGGRGMYGMNVHRAVVAAGDNATGITIHHVNERYDDGAVIFQATTAVAPGDTSEDVERKVHLLEREHFPRVVEEALCGGRG